MPERSQTIFYQSVADVLTQWNLPKDPWAEQIADHISRGTIQWQEAMPNGRSLHLLRVYAPIIQREEVFLGNVLLNDFFFKAMPTAAEQIGISQFTAVANDLESAYFLACGSLNIEQLQKAFLEGVSKQLALLYFGEAQTRTGIHGDFENLFRFKKSDFEPFPIYAIPEFLAGELEKSVRSVLYELLVNENYKENLKTVRSALSFFYGQTSGGMGDAQSFDMFLHRLIVEYDFIEAEEVKKLLGIESVDKLAIKTAFDNEQFDPEEYRFFLLKLLTGFGEAIDKGLSDWFLGFIFKDEKLIPLDLKHFLNEILRGVQIGTQSLISKIQTDAVVVCPICGQSFPFVRESYIVAGRAKNRFRTRDTKRGTKRQEPIVCTRCALSIYLAQRLLGNYEGVWQKQPRKTARMPMRNNLVFHYGQHKDEECDVFEHQLDYLVRNAREAEKNIDELKKGIEEIHHNILGIHKPIEVDDVFGEWSEPAVEVVAQLESNTRSRVLILGSGNYRLFVFILPPFRPSKKESEEFVQERFSGNRLAIFTLLALLRQLCGCTGPYYYRSIPYLSSDIEDDCFYVLNQKELASVALRKYGAVVNFAKRVSNYRPRYSPLTDWILLVERLLNDPLGEFSNVLRDSPVRLGDIGKKNKWKYKNLSRDWDSSKGLGVVDSTDYLALYEQLHELAKEMN